MESKPKLLIATSNPGKLKEFTLLLPDFEILSQETFGIIPEEEVGQTFFENSLHKARFAAHASGLSALGDDSGLIVPALNNMPGLHSARYAKADASDEENRKHLKKELIKIDVDETQAFFVCVLVMLNAPSDPFPLVATGMLEGTIKITSEGMNGFGYDPMFYPRGSNLSLAQMPNEEKAKLSHRSKAAETLRQKIKNFVSQ
ncbi:RdgB/HAM1 family non-canonical purine NTP pyrophosphatase [Gammaproteobacteria bacterium]|nr:RdgB/HAM1 family non-canonical purine NTP pyrophosphatase [Gammaproteobacteria bacterium]